MDLEKQVSNLKQSEKLKKLGVVQNSLFYHTHSEKWGVMPKKSIDFTGNPTSVFTVGELAEMLPDYHSSYRSDDGVYYTGIDEGLNLCFGKTFAESIANAVIILLESGKLKIEDVNSRLLL